MSADAKRTLLILLAAALTYFAGSARVGLIDRDEPRYAQCSRQMLESGDWVVPRLYDQLRAKKPPLIYWCQATAMKLLGSQGDAGVFAARLPSILAMLGLLAMLAIVIGRHDGSRQAMWTVFIFSTSALPIFCAKICLTDSVLALFTIAAQLCLFRLWRGDRAWGTFIAMAIALALGILTKGPFIVGILGCTTAALTLFRLADRWRARQSLTSRAAMLVPEDVAVSVGAPAASAHSLSYETAWRGSENPGLTQVLPSAGAPRSRSQTAVKWVVALLIVAAISLPWFWLVHRRAPEFLSAMGAEARGHALEGKEGHAAPPGYHLLMVWPMFMPWCLFLPLAIVTAIQSLRIPQVRFALAAVAGPWVMVECMGSKLPHYFLPAYPAMAYLVAYSIIRILDGRSPAPASRAFHLGAGAWAVGIAVAAAGIWIAAIWFHDLPWVSMGLLSALLLSLGGGVFILIRRARFRHVFWLMGAGSLAVFLLAFGLFLPNAGYLRLSPRVARALQDQGAIHPGDVKMIDYKEPSLGFYQGGTIREEGIDLVVARPVASWPRWLVLTQQSWDLIPPARRSVLTEVARFRGLNIADKGRIEDVMIVRKETR